MSARKSSVKCVRDVRELPLESYRLPNDGRKWKQLAAERQRLLSWLATFANGDGSSIYPGVDKMVAKLGMSRRTVFRRLYDLGPNGLGILRTDGQIQKQGQAPGTSRRSINLDAMQGGVSDSSTEGCQIQGGGVSDSSRGVSDTRGRGVTLGGTQPSFTDHNNRPPLPGSGGGGADAKISDEEVQDRLSDKSSLPIKAAAGRDVVIRLKRDFHAMHGTYPFDPSKPQVKQLVALAQGEEFWRAWKIFLSEGPCRPDTHSPWGSFIADFEHWLGRAVIRKPKTQDLPTLWESMTSSKGIIQ